MRLCYLANPQSIHTRRWLEYFVRQGHEVHLLTFYTVFSPIEGVKTHAIFPSIMDRIQRGRGWLALLFPWRIRKLVQVIEPDVFHAHYISFYGWMAALSGFHPLALTIWGGDILADQGAFRFPGNWLTPFSLKRADLITAVSQPLLTIARQYVRPATAGHVIRLGVDLNDFNSSSDAQEWRARLDLDGHPVILSPRVINPIYNIHTIVNSMPYVLEQIPNALFVFKDNTAIGQEGQAYRLQIRKMITDMKLDNAVRYAGEVPYPEMAAFYRLADVVVSVPLSDGLPVTVLEAMACGVPVILSKLPQLEELITADNALTVPAQDPQQLASAIIRLLNDQELRQKMITANLALIRAHGDFDAEMKKMGKLYEELI